MRSALLFALALVPGLAFAGQTAPVPKEIGAFRAWIAAFYVSGGKKVCYAFTGARESTPAIPGRGKVVLSVTERPQSRDEVALSAGYSYPPNAEVTVRADNQTYAFYTAGQAAFARDGASVIPALKNGITAVATGPQTDPGTPPVTDSFSLDGFTAAYEAVVKACLPGQ